VVGGTGILEAERAGEAPCYREATLQPRSNSEFKA
jgi:hypothetical protein